MNDWKKNPLIKTLYFYQFHFDLPKSFSSNSSGAGKKHGMVQVSAPKLYSLESHVPILHHSGSLTCIYTQAFKYKSPIGVGIILKVMIRISYRKAFQSKFPWLVIMTITEKSGRTYAKTHNHMFFCPVGQKNPA